MAGLQRSPSTERLMVSRVVWPAEREGRDEPDAGLRVEGDDRIARALVRAGRAARAASARAGGRFSTCVRRSLETCAADVRRRTVVAATDLVGHDGRTSDGEAVGLDLRLVLCLRSRVRVAREPSADELAVRGDGVEKVGVDDVGPGPAADRVARSVVAHGDTVGARAGISVSRPGPPCRKSGPEPDATRSRPPFAKIVSRPRRPGEAVGAPGAGDAGRGCGAGEDERD